MCRVGGGGVFERRGGAVVRRSGVWARWLRLAGYMDMGIVVTPEFTVVNVKQL